MSRETERKRFTKVATDLLIGVKDLVNWGMDTGNTTPDMMRLTVTARRETARALIAGGMSQRGVALALGVARSTVQADLAENRPESGRESATNSEETQARRAETAARSAAEGVTPVPAGKVRIVYADPPWDYGAHAQPDYFGEQRDHYATMPLADICALPVKDWVEDDAVLYLWTTSAMLEKSFEVIHAWGFEYKSTFIWDKIGHNMAHYNSMRHEILMICTRGACRPDVKQLFDSVQSIERRAHSQKPVEFYDIIETNYTHGRKLEMFARVRREGWEVYGHEAEVQEAAE